MPRGKAAKEGDTYWSQNGYHYTKRDGKFELTHKLIMEEKLGRKLTEGERVRFIDNDRRNLDPNNLKVVIKGQTALTTQRARLVARRNEIDAQIKDLDEKIALQGDRARLKQLENQEL
jgi:hypothetical protein